MGAIADFLSLPFPDDKSSLFKNLQVLGGCRDGNVGGVGKFGDTYISVL